MPGQSILKIREIFWSFQGEGLRAGFPSVFLRLSGCSLHCPYCDSKDTWETGNQHEKSITVDSVVTVLNDYLSNYPNSQIVITGGEPLEHDLSKIVNVLKDKNYFLCIETNGNHFQELPLSWWTVSPKDKSDYFIHPGLIEKINEIKLIVNSNLTIEIIRRIRNQVPEVPLFLQPDSSDNNRFKNTMSLYKCCVAAGIGNIRVGIQLHKIYGVP